MVARKKRKNTICDNDNEEEERSGEENQHLYQNSHYHNQQQQQQHLNLSAEQIYQRVGRKRSTHQLPVSGGGGSRHLYAQVRGQRGLRRRRQLVDGSSGGALLLCCVCEDKNSTYRYEVVYRSPAAAAAAAADSNSSKAGAGLTLLPVYATVKKRNKKVNVDDDEGEDNVDSEDHAYYNFPPRHPRHGHLRWPVLRPDSAAAIRDGVCRHVFLVESSTGFPERKIFLNITKPRPNS